MGIMIAAANSWGLFLCTFMLGYGLVKVPRVLWQTSSTTWHLTYLASQAPKMKEATIDSEAEVYEVARHIAVSSKRIPVEETELKGIADKLLEKCPLALQERTASDDGDDVSRVITKKGLVSLHARINRALKAQERDKAYVAVIFL
jgi:hypothetical protein